MKQGRANPASRAILIAFCLAAGAAAASGCGHQPETKAAAAKPPPLTPQQQYMQEMKAKDAQFRAQRMQPPAAPGGAH